MMCSNNNFIVWHDDSNMASPEEDAKYPLTKEQQRRLDERLEEVFRDFGLSGGALPEKPVTSSDVAKYILERQGKITTWELGKLCYYSQAWHYTWTGKQLIGEEVQAWCKGPVFPKLFALHVGKFTVSAEDFKFADSNKLNADAKDSIDIVLEYYGNMSAEEIVELTHKEDPWKNARGDLPDDAESKAIITLESMKEYYRKHLI